MLLADRTVVVVDPDGDFTGVVTQHLRNHGARCFHARDALTAAWGARETLPDVVVSELELPDLDGSSLILELRSSSECAGVPAIALTSNRSLIMRAQAERASFEKYLAKPVDLGDLLDAICSLIGSRKIPGPDSFPSLEELGECLERHDYRRLLGTLNATTAYRYTALFRYDGSDLRSVWTFDRIRPAADPFPPQVPVAHTPCALLLSDRRPLCIEDTTVDERVGRDQRHSHMRSCAGVPVFDESHAIVGALCHFDSQPRHTDAAALDLLERVARLFVFVNRRKRRSGAPR